MTGKTDKQEQEIGREYREECKAASEAYKATIAPLRVLRDEGITKLREKYRESIKPTKRLYQKAVSTATYKRFKALKALYSRGKGVN
jgi:hypothetical protein